MKNFYLYVDRQGKMPFMSPTKLLVNSHPYFIQYVNDQPVAYHGPKDILASDISGTKVYNYSKNIFQPIDGLKCI